MQITLYEVTVQDGDAPMMFRGLDRDALLHDIAAHCLKHWQHPDTWEGDSVPSLPATDKEILETYFDTVSWPEETTVALEDDAECYCDWQAYRLELAPPTDTPIDLSIDLPLSFAVMRSANGGARCQGTLLQGFSEISHALESLIVAQAAAGIPVHVKEFREALDTLASTLPEELSDYLEPPTREKMERALHQAGITLRAEGKEDTWTFSASLALTHRLLDQVTGYAWETRDEALQDLYNAYLNCTEHV